MNTGFRHTLAVEIFCDLRCGQRQAQDRLHRWLETFGHTAPSLGFEFRTVGRITGKPVDMKHEATPRTTLPTRRFGSRKSPTNPGPSGNGPVSLPDANQWLPGTTS